MHRSMLHADEAAEAFSARHQIEGRVDLGEGYLVGDELLQLQLLQSRVDSILVSSTGTENIISSRQRRMSVQVPCSCTAPPRGECRCEVCSARRRSPSGSARTRN